MRLFHGSIRKKLLTLVLLATAPVYLVFIVVELSNRQHSIVLAQNDNALFLKGFVEVQRRIADSTHTLLRTVASIPAIRDLDVEGARVILATLLETNPIYSNVILTDMDGNVVAAGRNHEEAKTLNFSDRKQFIEAIMVKGFACGEYVVGKVTQESIFPFGMAVVDLEGQVSGVLLIGARLEHFNTLFQRGNYPEGTFFGISDYKGIRLLCLPFTENNALGEHIKEDVYLAATKKGHGGAIQTVNADGVERAVVYEPIRLERGQAPYMYMFMGFDSKQILKRANEVTTRLFLTSLMALCLALVIAWYIGGRGIASRVEKLTHLAKKISQNEDDGVSGIDYDDGEVGALAQSFDTMLDMLRQRELDLVEALRKLQRSEERFREIIEAVSGIAVQGYDENGVVTFWNQASEKLYGYSKEEVAGKKLFDLIIPEEMKTEVQRLHWQWVVDGIKIPSEELVLVDKYGRDVPVFSSHVMHQTAQGKEMFCMDIDMRPIREAEEDKKELQKSLSQAQKMDAVGQLAGGIAHDFNNMLGGIIGAGEMLGLYLPDEPKAARYHKIILQSARRAADLTSKLLMFSRDSRIASTTVNVHKIIQETLVLLENTIDRRIRVKIGLEAKESTVKGDSSQLQNVFLNLAINASQAMPNGGLIEISSKNVDLDDIYCKTSTFALQPGPYLEVGVRDTGQGIPPDVMENIFEPFFTTKEQGKGTGLGLAAVYGTMNQHSGAVSVKSEVGVGSYFKLLFPLSTEEHAENTKEVIVRGEGTILFVDDEEGMRETGRDMLERLGYSVILAVNGQEALQIYQEQSDVIDLVILDMIMPVMNGKDCFDALCECDPDVLVILSSGFTREEDLKDMQEKGLKAFIRKPYRTGNLSQVVAEALSL